MSYSLRLLKMILLLSVAVGGLADRMAFGAVRFGARNHRSQRIGRPSRPNVLSGAVANVQKAVNLLNASRAEQSLAQRNLVLTRSQANAKYDNSKLIAQVGAEFDKTEAVHDQAKEKVLASLKKNDARYQAAAAKLTAIEEQLKTAISIGPQSKVEDLKSEAREHRLALSSLEGNAFKNDKETQAAQRLLDNARRRIQGLRKETEIAIAKDADLKNAKAKTTLANNKVSVAQANYVRAVANANAAAQIASNQAMRSRYAAWNRHGRGRHHAASRFRRYR